MIVVNRSRRQFLVGSGGFMLALPFLESLFTSDAEAQSAAAVKPRFVAMATPHGAAWGTNLFPDVGLLTNSQQLYSDHQIKSGTLKATVSGSNASLCKVLTAPSSLLSDKMVAKMLVLRGLDVPFYIAHNTGGHLGNFARSDREGAEADYVSKLGGYVPTIDQVMAYSSSFYSDLSSIKQRSMNIGTDGGLSISWGWANPSTKSGAVQPVPAANSALALFNSIFVASQPAPAASARTPIVDRVMDSFKRLQSGVFGDATRLSSADKQRLDDHMTRLSELQRQVTAVASASCSTVSKPGSDATRGFADNDVATTVKFYQLFNDVIVAAFICGTSRIATIYSDQLWSTYAGDWHQEVAHQADQPDGVKQGVICAAYQMFFEKCFLDLTNKLDAQVEANGKTYLDNTLVQWTQESGPVTHEDISTPVIAAGSAAGFFNTGVYADYRRMTAPSLGHTDSIPWKDLSVGVLYEQWLATLLQAMGVPPSEWERSGKHGYGTPYTDNYYGSNLWPQRLFDDASKVLPFLKKTA